MNTREIIAVAIVSTTVVIILNKFGVVDAIYKIIGGMDRG